MKKDTDDQIQSLEQNLELVRVLSQRVEMLEKSVEENAAQRMAAMLLLRALIHCAPNQDQVISLVERMTAQMNVQPGVLLGGGKSTFLRLQAHLDWMLCKETQKSK